MLARRASVVGACSVQNTGFSPVTIGVQRSLQRHYLEDKEASQRALIAMLRLRGVADDADLEHHVKRLHIIRTEIVKLRDSDSL
jgi:hypothetical protein